MLKKSVSKTIKSILNKKTLIKLTLLTCLLFAQGCSLYARSSAKSSYIPPEDAAKLISDKDDGPIVMLITGSMIVSDYFNVMKTRLTDRGFRTIVYQPPDLFTKSLKIGAQSIGEAVEKICTATGRDKLFLLAECNGGVAARYYVEKLGGAKHVDKLITFVSAHHGTGFMKWINPYPAIKDIRPDSEYMQSMKDSRPTADGPPVISIYLCSDEIMTPPETSIIHGAVNIEICDPGFDVRARKRKPYDVNHIVGWFLVRMYPVHLGVFWDEPFFNLLVSCIQDDPETIKMFDELKISFK